MEEPRGLSCSVCYNAFTSGDDRSVPRNLNCGHTFCTACLQKIAAQSLHVYVKCPACKSETPLVRCSHTTGSISSLPKNFGVLEIIECRERKSNNGHGNASAVDNDKAKSNSICEEHDEAKKVYCYTDQCLICIYCQIYGKHQGHECELASKLAKSSREELEKISQKLENERSKLCKATREITGMEHSILNQQFFLKDRVKKYMMLLHHYLTGREALLMSKIDDMTANKLQVLETQEKTLSEVITKFQELYLLIQTVQNDGDSSIIEDKPTIEKLVDEMSYLTKACQVHPKTQNNLIFEFDEDVLNILEKSTGKIVESEPDNDDEQTDGSSENKQHLVNNALANLEREMNISCRQLSGTNEQEGETIHAETDEDDDDDEGEDTSVNTVSSEEEEDEIEEEEEEEEHDGNEENRNDENESRAEDEEEASEGELLGAVGGDALPEAQQDESNRKDINEKQSLLRELQHEIERLRLLGPTGELIRVIDDSSSSSYETGTDTDDNEHDTHSLHLDFQIRVNNELSRSKSRGPAAAVQGLLPTKDSPVRECRKSKSPSRKKRCSSFNCEQHNYATLQCKNCNRVFCRRCASLSLTCNKSENGHNFSNYKHGHHLNKNIKSKLGKSSKLRKTCEQSFKSLVPEWVCKRCTMLNEGHVLVCGACETSKDYDPEESRNVCPMCTLVNEPGKTNCELCDTDLEEKE